jgi:hypothetical protein
MYGRTLIFVGDDDKIVVPESQGIALYKALHHRNVTTALYHYPGKHVICYLKQNIEYFRVADFNQGYT